MHKNMETTFIDAMVTGDTSGAIERSEKREQLNVVRDQRLPIKANDCFIPFKIRDIGITESMEWEEKLKIKTDNNTKWTKEQYAKIGIKIIEKYDDLFFNVKLPEGWEIKPTEHSMWNEVMDDKGRKRMTFFYKGAFYDRDAFVNFERRFTYREQPFDNYQTRATYKERLLKEWYGVVYDCEKEIFRTQGIIKTDYFDNSLNQQCIEYLNKHYPNYKDINAYWE